MKTQKKILYIVSIVILILTVFQFKKFYSNIKTSDKYFIICDPIFSESLSADIKKFINSDLKKKFPQDFTTLLQKKFPIVESVIIKRKNPDFLIIILNSCVPIYKINNTLVITKNEKLLPLTNFLPQVTENLENIDIHELSGDLSDDLKLFIKKLNPEIPQDYNITWKNKNYITLKDKTANLVIVFEHNQIITKKLIKNCRNIFREKLKDLNKANDKQIIADLRFANQIVISLVKGVK